MVNRNEILRDIHKIIEKLESLENGYPNPEIKQYNDVMTNIVSAIPDIFFVTDAEGKFLFHYGDHEKFYLSPSQFIGCKISEIFPPEFAEPVEKCITKVLLGEKVKSIYYKLRGHIWEARITKTVSGKILFIVRNITEDVENLLGVIDLNGKPETKS